MNVAVRIRPPNQADNGDSTSALAPSPVDPHAILVDEARSRAESRQFTFDEVFPPSSTQSEVFDRIGVPMLSEAFKGFNVCLFAYGQTGSGKTYSLFGEENQESRGVIPRFFRELFRQAQTNVEEDPDLNIKITLSFMEIYMEKVRDLLTVIPKGCEREALEIGEDTGRRVFVKGLTSHPVLSYDRALELLATGNGNRQQAETRMNEFSNRSHTILQLVISQAYDNSPDRRDVESVVWLVDLAGSERQSKTEASGLQLEEAKKINQSLLMLGRALNSFSEGRNDFLSLRESKLTRLLSECFGGNSKTWMLATVSPTAFNLQESLSTLEYASNAKRIKNRAVVNRKARQLELNELKQLALRLEAILEQERSNNQCLQLRHSTLKRDIAELQLLQFQESPSASVQLQTLNSDLEAENTALRSNIEKLTQKLEMVESKGSLNPNTKNADRVQTQRVFVGRCSLSLTNVVTCRSAEPWKLRAVDSNGSEAILMVKAFPVDTLDETVPSSSPPPLTTEELIGQPLLLYVSIVGAIKPDGFSGSTFCRLMCLDDRFSAPQSTQVSKDVSPTWDFETIVGLPNLTQSLLERLATHDILHFEVYGCKE
jgi:hypothetical protein